MGTHVRIIIYRQSSAADLNFSAVALINDHLPGVHHLRLLRTVTGAARRAVRLRVRVMGSSGERRSRVGETGRDARAGKAARGELGAGRTFAVATRGATPTKAEQPRRAAIVRAT